MRLTGESHYGDGLERILYNGILAALPMGPEGKTFYYSDYSANAKKSYFPDPWPCCSGTYPQVVADYLVSAYFHDDDGIYVNLFVPSEMKWKGMTITQETDYPADEHSTLHIKGGGRASIHIRIPSWAKSFRVLLSRVGSKPTTVLTPGFHTLTQDWKDGDTIIIQAPMEGREEPIDPADPKLVARMKGPVMLVNSESNWTPFYRVTDRPYTAYVKKV
jgi:DUF1680 family protein